MFSLLGSAVRIAIRLGLHRDGAQFGLSPFETEQRRRLWWQIVVFDKRIAEITGSATNALSSCDGDTRLPLNVNDADLDIDAKIPPVQSAGPTEMVFCLTRIELTVAASPDRVRRAITTPGGRPLNPSRVTTVHYSPSPSSTDMVTHMANQYLPSDLATFCSYMESVYLKQCDPKIPLHFFTLLMTRQALCKLRLIDFLRRASAEDVEQRERDDCFLEALRMLEYDNVIQSSEMLQRFRWYTLAHFPLPAYLCLVSDLRHRTTGELCERAWNVMIENHERRKQLRRSDNPLHVALGRYLVKAWDAREAAERQLGRTLHTPSMVVLLRNKVANSRRPAPPPAPNAGSAGAKGAPTGQRVPPVQPVAQAGVDNTIGLHAIGDTSRAPTGLVTDMYPGEPMPQATTAPPLMGGPGVSESVMLDDSAAYPGYDGAGHVFTDHPPPAPFAMQDVEVGEMDWNYLVQLTSFGGFNPPGSYYLPGPGA